MSRTFRQLTQGIPFRFEHHRCLPKCRFISSFRPWSDLNISQVAFSVIRFGRPWGKAKVMTTWQVLRAHGIVPCNCQSAYSTQWAMHVCKMASYLYIYIYLYTHTNTHYHVYVCIYIYGKGPVFIMGPLLQASATQCLVHM